MLGFYPLASAPLGDDGVAVVGNYWTVIGVASFGVSGQRIVPASSNPTASGLITATVNYKRPVSTSLSGTGSITPLGKARKYPTLNLVGLGTVSPLAKGEFKAVSSYLGIGTLNTVGVLLKPVFSSVSGIGSTTNNAVRRKVVQVSLTSSGSVSGFLTSRSAFFGPYGANPIRDLEDSNSRVTEDSNVRITEDSTENTGVGTVLVDATFKRFSNVIYIKNNGVWKITKPYIKYNGNWVEPHAIYKNINGDWKRIA